MIPVAALGVTAGLTLLLAPDPAKVREDDFPIPLPIARNQWLAFVKLLASGKRDEVTPNFRLGVFQMTVRRLCDIGAMANPRMVEHEGRNVWDADWVNPVSLRAFLDNGMTQYTLFSQSIQGYANDEKLRSMVGATIDNSKATLSGLLTVAHRAGLPGLSTWVTDPKNRAKFSENTTAHYARANGLF
jgi:hypothetical protein